MRCVSIRDYESRIHRPGDFLFFLISFLTAAFGMRNRSRSITATPGRLAALYHENSF